MRHLTRILAVATALALLVAAGGCTTKVVTAPSEGAMANTVTASGNGVVSAPPDEAVMSFGVTRQDPNAAKALSKASAAAEKIGAALAKQGVKKEDVQTSNVSVYPRYARQGGKEVIKGFEASINVTARVKDLDKLGETISALAAAGADNVNGPSFTIAEDAPYRSEAIKEAVEDARAQATEMAAAAGKRVGDVVSITSTAVNVPRLQHGTYALDYAKAAAVPIETGQLDVTADLTVVFALE